MNIFISNIRKIKISKSNAPYILNKMNQWNTKEGLRRNASEANIQLLTPVGRGSICFNNDAGEIKFLLQNVDNVCVSKYILK